MDFFATITKSCEESENDIFLFPRSKKPRMDFLRPYKYWTVILSVVAALWLTILLPPSVHAQGDVSVDSRQLTIIEPDEDHPQLDPAFDMIMEKLDRDLDYLLSAQFRMTPKGTAYLGVTLLTTIYLLDFDDEYLDDISSKRGESSDRIYSRLNCIGSNIPEIAAGMYLLGGFLKSQTLKTKSLQGLEASALTALVAIGTGYLIGHVEPDQANDAGEFKILTENRSMPDLNTALSFSFAAVLAHEQRLLPQIAIYSLTTGIGLARLYDRHAWPSDVFFGAVLGLTIGRTVANLSTKPVDEKLSFFPVVVSSSQPSMGVGVNYSF
jgi:hypothetical protein